MSDAPDSQTFMKLKELPEKNLVLGTLFFFLVISGSAHTSRESTGVKFCHDTRNPATVLTAHSEEHTCIWVMHIYMVVQDLSSSRFCRRYPSCQLPCTRNLATVLAAHSKADICPCTEASPHIQCRRRACHIMVDTRSARCHKMKNMAGCSLIRL